MVIKGYTKWSVFALIGIMTMQLSSCTVHRHSRSHHHHPHRHKVMIIAEQATATE